MLLSLLLVSPQSLQRLQTRQREREKVATMAASHINRQVEILCPSCLQVEIRNPYSDFCCGPKIGII